MTFVDLLNEYHIIPQFPPSVVRWTESVPKAVSREDLKDREDLTERLTITIDGDDAKDFDDAVSLEVLENKNYLLGVHIADVTHYVKENSAVDRAAFSRGTSVYLIDTVIPMLPFELSNELCSLKPDEVRLTVSVFMEIEENGNIKGFKISKSFIKSKARMTYKNVTKILEGDKALLEKYKSLAPMLKNMEHLAKILNKKRVREGSIEFVTHEAMITLDKKGVPVSVGKYPITISNNIIEEFMLAANVTVAKYLSQKKLPCVYRIHEAPDFERVKRLSEVLPSLGVEFPFKANMKPKDFQDILKSAADLDTKDVINYLVLRTMSRARYHEKNQGHFGLSFSDYCHFTSPIRRYPDMVVHRILKESLKGEISASRKKFFDELTVAASISSSLSETNAAEAELRWKDIKKAEYMASHIGEKHMATITHVTQTGFFAQLSNTVEGFVAARTINDDLYMMTENGLSLKGTKTKRSFTVGDSVEIKVAAVSLGEGKIDFELTGTGILKPHLSNKRKLKSKDRLSREDKEILRKFKEKHREERDKKLEIRKKADTERYIFENAVIFVTFDILTKGQSLKKGEKNFLGVMLKDFAATIAMPVYRAYVFDDDKISFENTLIFASKETKNLLGIISESFNLPLNEKTDERVLGYVLSALLHFSKSLEYEKFNFSKREQEYLDLKEK